MRREELVELITRQEALYAAKEASLNAAYKEKEAAFATAMKELRTLQKDAVALLAATEDVRSADINHYEQQVASFEKALSRVKNWQAGWTLAIALGVAGVVLGILAIVLSVLK
jgi:hypothetical protein